MKARFCFLKSDFAKSTPFKGAISGRVVTQSTEPDLGAAPGLSFLSGSWYQSANDMRRKLPRTNGNDGLTGFEIQVERGRAELGFDNFAFAMSRFEQALGMRPESSSTWSALSSASYQLAKTTKNRSEARKARNKAVNAAINAYSTSRYRIERAEALSHLAHSLELASWFREALSAYKMGLALDENPADRNDYMALLQAHGFRMLNHSVDSDLKAPRACLQFSENVKERYGDFCLFHSCQPTPSQSN